MKSPYFWTAILSEFVHTIWVHNLQMLLFIFSIVHTWQMNRCFFWYISPTYFKITNLVERTDFSKNFINRYNFVVIFIQNFLLMPILNIFLDIWIYLTSMFDVCISIESSIHFIAIKKMHKIRLTINVTQGHIGSSSHFTLPIISTLFISTHFLYFYFIIPIVCL